MRPTAVPYGQRGLRDLFIGAYKKFADRCREVEEPGLAVIAVDERDLYLTGSSQLALRHLAIILDPVTSWKAGDKGVRYRVLDLRTSDGFTDEEGRTLRGLRCEGPAILRCAGHALFILPLGDPTDWAASADDAWECLPERVYFDEVDTFPQGSMPKMVALRTCPGIPMSNVQSAAGGMPIGTNVGQSPPKRSSVITRTHGPRDSAVNMLAESGDLAGTLELI